MRVGHRADNAVSGEKGRRGERRSERRERVGKWEGERQGGEDKGWGEREGKVGGERGKGGGGMRRNGVREGKGGGERDRSHHDREHYADVWYHLEDTEQQEEGHLVECVGVDAEVGDAA